METKMPSKKFTTVIILHFLDMYFRELGTKNNP